MSVTRQVPLWMSEGRAWSPLPKEQGGLLCRPLPQPPSRDRCPRACVHCRIRSLGSRAFSLGKSSATVKGDSQSSSKGTQACRPGQLQPQCQGTWFEGAEVRSTIVISPRRGWSLFCRPGAGVPQGVIIRRDAGVTGAQASRKRLSRARRAPRSRLVCVGRKTHLFHLSKIQCDYLRFI